MRIILKVYIGFPHVMFGPYCRIKIYMTCKANSALPPRGNHYGNRWCLAIVISPPSIFERCCQKLPNSNREVEKVNNEHFFLGGGGKFLLTCFFFGESEGLDMEAENPDFPNLDSLPFSFLGLHFFSFPD